MSPKRRTPYQDKWRDGTLVRKGRRECAGRFAAIHDVLLRELGDDAFVLDVGGWDGYFARRLSEAGMTVTMMEPRRVVDLGGTGIAHVQASLTADNVSGVPYHDAVLLLAVLHHMPDWQEVYEALRSKSRVIVAEVADPEEAASGRPLTPTLIHTRPQIGPAHERLTRDGELIHTTPGPNKVDRSIVLVRNTWMGMVEDGSGRAAPYMADPSLDEGHWDELGYEPHPGTLNIHVGTDGRRWVSQLPRGSGRSTEKLPGPYWPVWLSREENPSRRQEAHVRLSRAKATVEIVAPVHLRTAMALENGDRVRVEVR